jgi:hypothetical protein
MSNTTAEPLNAIMPATTTPIPTEQLTPIEDNSSESLPAGQVKVTGTFREDVPGLFPNALVFTTNTAVTNIPKGTGFYFNNYTTARSLLKISQAGTLGNPGCDYISGKAEIVISEYKPQDTTQSESVNSAKILSVSKILIPAQCGRGAGN